MLSCCKGCSFWQVVIIDILKGNFVFFSIYLIELKVKIFLNLEQSCGIMEMVPDNTVSHFSNFYATFLTPSQRWCWSGYV